MTDLSHPHYIPASPVRRFWAAFLNLALFRGLVGTSEWIASAYFPAEEYETTRKLFLLGFSIVFWLGCSVIRSSPGALLLQLRLYRPDCTKVGFSDALIRSGFYFLFVVLTLAPKPESPSLLAAFVGIVGTAYFLAVLANGVVLGFTGATLMDRLTNSTFVSLSLPKQHIPKVMGVRIK